MFAWGCLELVHFHFCTALNGAYCKEHYPLQYTQVITKLWHTRVFNGHRLSGAKPKRFCTNRQAPAR